MPKNKIKKIAEEFFAKMDFSGEIEVTEEPEMIWVNFETKDSAFLIGHHGETLKAVAWILKLKLGEEGRNLILDINNYKRDRKERLNNMAIEIANKARATSKPQVMPPMSAYERRLVHVALIDQPDIVAESEGEEPNRRIIIRIKE
ncbi:MAG: KH domain-containing protein [Patescibacteria group bacterium]|nr:KH domain-containing protein [Patescibacteria group bacterium]